MQPGFIVTLTMAPEYFTVSTAHAITQDDVLVKSFNSELWVTVFNSSFDTAKAIIQQVIDAKLQFATNQGLISLATCEKRKAELTSLLSATLAPKWNE